MSLTHGTLGERHGLDSLGGAGNVVDGHDRALGHLALFAHDDERPVKQLGHAHRKRDALGLCRDDEVGRRLVKEAP